MIPRLDLRDLFTDAAYRVRSRLTWAPAGFHRRGSLARVLARLPPAAATRARSLLAHHDTSTWEPLLSDLELHENLYALDLLTTLAPGARAPGLDVGAKDGSLLPALQAAAPGPWDLVEIDAHRRYADFSTRRSHGERRVRAYPGSRYLAASVTTLAGPYHLITWFLPFVVPEPLRAWGLPERLYAPEALLAHVLGLLAPGACLLVVNQGERERDRQAELFELAAVAAEALGPVASPLSPFRRPRFAFRVTRR
jgi:hypothetical protein